MRLIKANMDIDELIKNQDTVHWNKVLINNNKFTKEEINKLCANINNSMFWMVIGLSSYTLLLDVKYLVQIQDDCYWHNIFYRPFTDEEIKYLCDNVQNNNFWYDISQDRNYVQYIDINHLIKHQKHVQWEYIFRYRKFTEAEKEYLYNNVKNENCLKILNTEFKVKKMSYQELINNKNNINWKKIDLEKLSIGENEKKLLLTRIPELGIKNAENIASDFSQIKDKPINNFYIIGNRKMHGNRTGAFVVAKDGSHPVEVLVEPGGYHKEMLLKMAKEYGYDDETMLKLMNVEAGMEEISGKMDLDSEIEKELEYAKEHLHCCCGYIHVDGDNKNPIAIMDATRVYNFSPQQVANILKDKKYEGQDIIAFGINDPCASSVAFMKVAKLSHKRLIPNNFRILYWYNKK